MFTLMAVLGLCALGHCILGRPQPEKHSIPAKIETGYQYAKPSIGGKPLSTFTFEDFPESPRIQHASPLSPTWDSSPLSQKSQNQSSAGQTHSNSSQAEEGYQYAKPAIGGKSLSTFTFEDFPESPLSQPSTLSPTWDRSTLSQTSQNQSSAGQTRSSSSQAEEGYQYDKPAIAGKALSTFTFEDFPESPRSHDASTLSPTWDSSSLSQKSQNQSSAGQTHSNSSQAEEGYQYAKPAIGGKSLSTFTFEDFPESPLSQPSTLSPTWDRSTLSQTSQNQSSAGQTRSSSSQAEEGYQYDKPAIAGKALSTFTFEDFPESPRSQDASTLSPTWDSSSLSQRSLNQSSAGQTRSNSSQAEEGYQYEKPGIGGKALSTFTFEDFLESPRSQSQRSQNQSSAGYTRSNSSQAEEGYQYDKPAIVGKTMSTFTFEEFPGY